MNWKVFITASVSCLLLAFPQNSFTCGPSEDPHDYYTSFFSNKAGTSKAYEPFYYTALLTFYDDWDWNAKEDSTAFINQRIVEEWRDYGKATRSEDAVALVYFTSSEDLRSLLASTTSGKPMSAKFAKNSLVQSLIKEKRAEALSYLVFAKKTEDVSTTSDWEEPKRDSLLLNQFIQEANEAYAKASDPFIKNKYAFQRCKLAFYNNRHEDCIRWYDEHFTDANTSAVHEMALSYKAGSLFRLGRNKEAASAFSKVFPLSDQHKRNHFLGFLWATDNCNPALIPEFTALCKNNKEKANMLGLFALHGTNYRLEQLQQVYELDPSSPLLPLLATREINKLEEQYFTPELEKEKGGKALYVSWAMWRDEENAEKEKVDGRTQAGKTAQLFEKLLNDKAIQNRDLYGAGAAYLHFITKDYDKAKSILAKTNEIGKNEKVKEQAQLINLLIAANETGAITKERETQLLPSMKWLVQKALVDQEYLLFCRNFFSQILAQKYEQQGNAARAALSYGLADLSFLKLDENHYYYSYPPAIKFVQEEMTTEQLLNLYEVMTKPTTEVERFFVQYASVKRDDVIDVMGTSFLRDRNYTKAIEWLSKASKLEPLTETQYNYHTGKEKTVHVDPFFDYLNDWQRYNKSVTTPYTKLTLAKKLLELQTRITSGNLKEDRSKLYYQYASALYNMSYYGNSWNAVAYERSSSNWNDGTYDVPWEKEYFGVYEARNYYQKAYDVATDKEFKAACLFMVAKCAQRQIPLPAYDYNNYEKYEKEMDMFYQKFKNNPLFGKFKSEFGKTKFYQYAYNRCSYLRDYVSKGNKAAPRKK